MKKWLTIGLLAAMVMLATPKMASAEGRLPPPPPGCANIMIYWLTGGACATH